jgi:hypothetical protein
MSNTPNPQANIPSAPQLAESPVTCWATLLTNFFKLFMFSSSRGFYAKPILSFLAGISRDGVADSKDKFERGT